MILYQEADKYIFKSNKFYYITCNLNRKDLLYIFVSQLQIFVKSFSSDYLRIENMFFIQFDLHCILGV